MWFVEDTSDIGLFKVDMKVKENVKFSLWLINYTLCHEDILGSGDITAPFLTSALDQVQWSASRLSRSDPGESTPVPNG
jgi:hypothetical protein